MLGKWLTSCQADLAVRDSGCKVALQIGGVRLELDDANLYPECLRYVWVTQHGRRDCLQRSRPLATWDVVSFGEVFPAEAVEFELSG